MKDSHQHPASFRDPSGFVFERDGIFYRQVNLSYAKHYNHFMQSGLYGILVKKGQLLVHTELSENLTGSNRYFTNLLPEQLTSISYPYEWCFSQWKDAALLTLDLMKTSMDKGMILKDATPFNIQFIDNYPVFIDTLSFELYDASKPWIAYKQFIECLLAPLLLARYCSPELVKIFQLYPDGIPLQLLTRLLPWKLRLRLPVLLHVFLPARVQAASSNTEANRGTFSKQKLSNIIQHLRSFILSLNIPDKKSNWNNYYQETVLSNAYLQEKLQVIGNWLGEVPIRTIQDVGTNTGLFASMAAAMGKSVIAIDADSSCIDVFYRKLKAAKTKGILPLVVDITNPSAAMGWMQQERAGFLERSHAELCMALALVHHLAIGKNIGFKQLVEYFAHSCSWLIVEFVPKSDEKVQLLLKNREDIFPDYDELHFEQAFAEKFTILKKNMLVHSGRTLFLMKKKIQ
jgi:hypothetical protein